MTKFLELTFSGVALGSMYALVALGFVIIYRATGVINFAQGGFVVLGAYLTYNAGVTWGLPFYVAMLVAMVMMALLGVVVEAVILRRMVGQPVFATTMITIGLLFAIEQVATTIWGFNALALGDPWGGSTTDIGDLTLINIDLYRILFAGVVVAAFFALFQLTKLGVAMRATALDQEAALAQGISARTVFAVSWAISGAVAALAGVMLTGGPAGGGLGIQVGVAFIALRAFPAMILGGLDSPLGAVVGGIIIGITQQLTAGYQPEHAPWLGVGFDSVMPYVVMVIILLVRPYGLFGAKEVHRV